MIPRGCTSANDLAVYYLLLKSLPALPHDSADEVFSNPVPRFRLLFPLPARGENQRVAKATKKRCPGHLSLSEPPAVSDCSSIHPAVPPSVHRLLFTEIREGDSGLWRALFSLARSWLEVA